MLHLVLSLVWRFNPCGDGGAKYEETLHVFFGTPEATDISLSSHSSNKLEAYKLRVLFQKNCGFRDGSDILRDLGFVDE